MAVHYRLNIRPDFVNLAMDETLVKTAAAICVNRIAVEVVFDDVFRRHQGRCDRPRHQITIRRRRMAQRNMAKGIDYALRRQYAAGCSEICDERGGNWAAGFIRHGADDTILCLCNSVPDAFGVIGDKVCPRITPKASGTELSHTC